MTVSQIKSKLLNDFAFFCNVVVNNNNTSVNNAIQNVMAVYFNLAPAECYNYVMSVYRGNPNMAAQLLNVRYIYGVLPAEYDQAVRELAQTAFAGNGILLSTQKNSDGTQESDWDFNQLLDSLLTNADDIITSVGLLFNPDSQNQTYTPNQTIDTNQNGDGNNGAGAQQPNYTPWIVAGGALLLFFVALALYLKAKKK